MTKPTPRQIEVLVNVYLNDQSWDGHRSQDRHSWVEGDEHAHIPPWGRPDRFGKRSRGMGGAARRMWERMQDEGLFEDDHYKSGSRRLTLTITAKGLTTLRFRYPDLPGIEQAITDRKAVEEAKASEEQAKAEAEREECRTRAAADRDAQVKALRALFEREALGYENRSDDDLLKLAREIRAATWLSADDAV